MADSYQMFINGEWVNSQDGQTRDVINPATGEVIASVQEGSAEDANRAVAAARSAFYGDWYDSTPKDRQLGLLKLADAIEANAEELVRLESINVGKPVAVSPVTETSRTSGCFTSWSPTSEPWPVTTLSTPGGRMSCESSARRSVVRGVSSAVRRRSSCSTTPTSRSSLRP